MRIFKAFASSNHKKRKSVTYSKCSSSGHKERKYEYLEVASVSSSALRGREKKKRVIVEKLR